MTRTHQRKDKRFDTPMLVFLENARGVTRDTSTSGAFFWTSGTYTPGQPISFAIELKTAGGRMMWKCKGEVLRAKPRDDDVGVAVRITESAMEPMEE